MNPVTSVLLLLGALVALLAGIGLLTFNTPYARFHAAGKASPIAFLLVAIGAGIEVGLSGATELAIVGSCAVAHVAREHPLAVPGHPSAPPSPSSERRRTACTRA